MQENKLLHECRNEFSQVQMRLQNTPCQCSISHCMESSVNIRFFPQNCLAVQQLTVHAEPVYLHDTSLTLPVHIAH